MSGYLFHNPNDGQQGDMTYWNGSGCQPIKFSSSRFVSVITSVGEQAQADWYSCWCIHNFCTGLANFASGPATFPEIFEYRLSCNIFILWKLLLDFSLIKAWHGVCWWPGTINVVCIVETSLEMLKDDWMERWCCPLQYILSEEDQGQCQNLGKTFAGAMYRLLLSFMVKIVTGPTYKLLLSFMVISDVYSFLIKKELRLPSTV